MTIVPCVIMPRVTIVQRVIMSRVTIVPRVIMSRVIIQSVIPDILDFKFDTNTNGSISVQEFKFSQICTCAQRARRFLVFSGDMARTSDSDNSLDFVEFIT